MAHCVPGAPRPGLSALSGSFAGARVLIVGLARQGQEMVRFFADQGARITAHDRAVVAALPKLPRAASVRYVFGPHDPALLTGQQLVGLSAGAPPQLPLVRAAQAQGLPVVNDSVLTFARVAGTVTLITGSSGKTTTTALTGALLEAGRAAQGKVYLGGNIGQPLLQRAHAIGAADHVVWEGSSFQLELFDAAYHRLACPPAPVRAAAILNLTPNHLDRHAGMAAYLQAKLRALRTLRPGGALVLNFDDPACRRLAPDAPAAARPPLNLPESAACEAVLARGRQVAAARRARIIPYSLDAPLPQGACLAGDTIRVDGAPMAHVQDIQLRGRHNVSNVLAACALAHAHDVPPAAARRALRAFRGVSHRLETVACRGGVQWVNDSIATSPERAVAGMRSFDGAETSLILLAGGQDKNLPWDGFARVAAQCVQTLILFGDAGPRIAAAMQAQAPAGARRRPAICVVDTLAQAVSAARRHASVGSVVLLSPGGTSFDSYRDFEARGRHFRQLARAEA